MAKSDGGFGVCPDCAEIQAAVSDRRELDDDRVGPTRLLTQATSRAPGRHYHHQLLGRRTKFTHAGLS